MKTKGIEIPQAAIDVGNAAMKGSFRALAIQNAVAGALRPLAETGGFDYGRVDQDELEMRVADALIQQARRKGVITLGKANHWQGA